jgi:uncharacterized protein
MPPIFPKVLSAARGEGVRNVMNREDFLAAVLTNPVNEAITRELFALALSDAWLVSGCLVQTVWNAQTGRDAGYGISDYDVFYFDPDTSWEAEDAVIRKFDARLAKLGVRIETRNQARVHLWYAAKHGLPYPPLQNSTEGIDRFLTANTMVGIRRTAGGYEIHAPNGFADIADLVVRPNPGPNFSPANYAAKAARWKKLWPEVEVMEADAVIASQRVRAKRGPMTGSATQSRPSPRD